MMGLVGGGKIFEENKTVKKTDKLQQLKQAGEAPDWMTDEGFKTLSGTYLLPGESPKAMWNRVSNSVAGYLKKPELAAKFFDLLWRNWLGLASPVAANCGTDRGLPISCFSTFVPDSIDGIMGRMHELATMTKNGGGVGVHWNKVRPRNAIIRGNGRSEGVVPFIKIQDSTTVGVSQGGVRRGASVGYLPIEHGDFWEFIKIRRPEGDQNRQCQSIHHAVNVSDEFMQSLKDGHKENRLKWQEVLKTRMETGEPYIFFTDTVRNSRPESYIRNSLEVHGSNLCSEILLATDEEHSFVCCLSSLNLARWDEWKDTDAVELSVWFLDGVLSEFIDKASKINGMERAVKSAIAGRALGLGVFGFHTYLQEHSVVLDSFECFQINAQMFSGIKRKAEKATQELAAEYGEPEWCKGLNRRNTHLIALAPTVSNSLISGNLSPSIEPWAANVFVQKSAKGTIIQKNKTLTKLLESYGKNTEATWKSIERENGSVHHLDFLTVHEKEVFLTAKEMNQFALVKLAAQRQRWIDQGQSLNLFFPENSDPKYIHDIHVMAHEEGLRTLYYLRTSSVIRGDAGSREYRRESTECKACEG